MIVSTLFLSADDYYATEDNKLPCPRPEFDKRLLTELVRGQVISIEGRDMLPPSIRKNAQALSNVEPTIGITIPEIAGLTDLLIVVRSLIPLGRGKKFRLDKFKRIVHLSSIELWVRK